MGYTDSSHCDDIDITCFAFRNLGCLERRETGLVLFSLIVQAIGGRIKINQYISASQDANDYSCWKPVHLGLSRPHNFTVRRMPQININAGWSQPY